MNKFYIFFMSLGLTFFSLITPARSMEAGDSSPKENILSACKAEAKIDRVTEWVAQQALNTKIRLRDNYCKKLAILTKNIKGKSAPFFASNSKSHPNAVVFDVDGTTLVNPETLAILYPVISRIISRPVGGKLLAICPMLDLCNFFVKNGFIIIFITAREKNLFKDTFTNLFDAGYTINRLFCMPPQTTMEVQEYLTIGKDKKASESIARWKAIEIDDLMTLYNIVAVIDDSEDNITEAEKLLPGRCFKVPTPDNI